MKLALFCMAVLLFGGCTAEQASRNVYEGVRARDRAREGTIQEQSKDRLPDYDQYEKERRR